MTTHGEIRTTDSKPRWRAWALFGLWSIFTLMTVWATVYQTVSDTADSGWLMLTFLYVFSVLMLWGTYDAFKRARSQ